MKTFQHLIYGLMLCVLTLQTELCAQAFVEDDDKYGPGKVYMSPEVTASFPGGRERFYDYLNLKFDMQEDQSLGMGGAKEGLIEAQFIIEPNGKVKYVEILQSLSVGYDDEMTRALVSMPKWKPAMVNGEAVRSFYKLRYTLNFYMR